MDHQPEAHHELARWLSGVNAFITAVNRPVSLRELLDLVTATACDLLGYDSCGVLLVQPEQRRLLMEGAHGLSTEYVAQLNDQVPLSLAGDGKSESPSARAFLSARPVVINDVAADPLMKPWQNLAKQQGYRSIVSMPLLLKGRPFGVLNGYSAKRNGISASSVELLHILANQAATAIESIHLRDGLRENISRLGQANDALRQQSRLLEQAHEVHKRLNGVALGAGGLEEISLALQVLLGHDVVIEDVHGRHLAPGDAASPGFPDLSSLQSHDDTAEICEVAAGQETPQSILTMVPVRIAGEIVARVWVNARMHELGELDRRALESANVIFALELMRVRAAQEVEWRVQGDIVNAMLHSHPSEFAFLIPRARTLGHDLEVPHLLMLLTILGDAGPAPRGALGNNALARSITRTVETCLESTGSRPLVAVDDGRIVILAPLAEDVDRTAQLDQLHRRMAGRHGLQTFAVIGTVCSSPADYPRALRIARGATALRERQGERAGTLVLGDLGIVSLLLQVDSPDDLEAFAMRTLGALTESDATKDRVLEETLRAYFRYGCNVTSASTALFVHPNTVRMRLRKIEGLLGCLLSDPEDVLNLRAAVLIMDVMQAVDQP